MAPAGETTILALTLEEKGGAYCRELWIRNVPAERCCLVELTPGAAEDTSVPRARRGMRGLGEVQRFHTHASGSERARA